MGDLENSNNSLVEGEPFTPIPILSFSKKEDGSLIFSMDKDIRIMDLIFLIKHLKDEVLKELIENELR